MATPVSKTLRTAAWGVALACAGFGAQAQSPYRACVISSTLQVMGTPTVHTDCLQGAKGVKRSVIKERCEGVAWHNAGGMGRRNSALLEWAAQCPKQADAVCEGAFDGDFDVHYYNRNTGQLAALAEQCATEQGRWREF